MKWLRDGGEVLHVDDCYGTLGLLKRREQEYRYSYWISLIVSLGGLTVFCISVLFLILPPNNSNRVNELTREVEEYRRGLDAIDRDIQEYAASSDGYDTQIKEALQQIQEVASEMEQLTPPDVKATPRPNEGNTASHLADNRESDVKSPRESLANILTDLGNQFSLIGQEKRDTKHRPNPEQPQNIPEYTPGSLDLAKDTPSLTLMKETLQTYDDDLFELDKEFERLLGHLGVIDEDTRKLIDIAADLCVGSIIEGDELGSVRFSGYEEVVFIASNIMSVENAIESANQTVRRERERIFLFDHWRSLVEKGYAEDPLLGRLCGTAVSGGTFPVQSFRQYEAVSFCTNEFVRKWPKAVEAEKSSWEASIEGIAAEATNRLLEEATRLAADAEFTLPAPPAELPMVTDTPNSKTKPESRPTSITKIDEILVLSDSEFFAEVTKHEWVRTEIQSRIRKVIDTLASDVPTPPLLPDALDGDSELIADAVQSAAELRFVRKLAFRFREEIAKFLLVRYIDGMRSEPDSTEHGRYSRNIREESMVVVRQDHRGGTREEVVALEGSLKDLLAEVRSDTGQRFRYDSSNKGRLVRMQARLEEAIRGLQTRIQYAKQENHPEWLAFRKRFDAGNAKLSELEEEVRKSSVEKAKADSNNVSAQKQRVKIEQRIETAETERQSLLDAAGSNEVELGYGPMFGALSGAISQVIAGTIMLLTFRSQKVLSELTKRRLDEVGAKGAPGHHCSDHRPVLEGFSYREDCYRRPYECVRNRSVLIYKNPVWQAGISKTRSSWSERCPAIARTTWQGMLERASLVPAYVGRRGHALVCVSMRSGNTCRRRRRHGT